MQTWMHILIYIVAYINAKLISYKLNVYCYYATLACSYILLLEWCKLFAGCVTKHGKDLGIYLVRSGPKKEVNGISFDLPAEQESSPTRLSVTDLGGGERSSRPVLLLSWVKALAVLFLTCVF